jgi:hypothetical protein
MANYRKIWENANGPIPKDQFGKSYEIHHIDGNRKNNELSNLQCVSIEEHYKIHLEQKEYGSAFIIGQRMNLSLEEMKLLTEKMAKSKIGKDPWNKGKTGIYDENTIQKLSNSVKRTYEENPERKRISISNMRKGIEEAMEKDPNFYKRYKEKNPFYGKTHSEDVKNRIKEKLKGRVPWNKGKTKTNSI